MNKHNRRMKKEYLPIEKPTTEAKEGRLYAALWIVLMGLFTSGTILSRYEEPEPISAPYIQTFEGYLINMEPHYIDEHCTNN